MQRPEHAAMRAVYIELTKKRIFGITSVNFFRYLIKPLAFF
jgi:hypothetical protein